MKAKRYSCPRDGCHDVIREKPSIGHGVEWEWSGWGRVVEMMLCYRSRWGGSITETNTNPGHERLCPDCGGTLILAI